MNRSDVEDMYLSVETCIVTTSTCPGQGKGDDGELGVVIVDIVDAWLRNAKPSFVSDILRPNRAASDCRLYLVDPILGDA